MGKTAVRQSLLFLPSFLYIRRIVELIQHSPLIFNSDMNIEFEFDIQNRYAPRLVVEAHRRQNVRVKINRF